MPVLPVEVYVQKGNEEMNSDFFGIRINLKIEVEADSENRRLHSSEANFPNMVSNYHDEKALGIRLAAAVEKLGYNVGDVIKSMKEGS